MNKHYINGFTGVVLANATTDLPAIEMPRDGFDIDIEEISITTLQAGAIVAPNFTFQLTEQGGSNRTLFVGPQHARNLAGDGSKPWKLAEPWRVAGNLRLACNVSNLTAVDTTIYVTLHGRKVDPAYDYHAAQVERTRSVGAGATPAGQKSRQVPGYPHPERPAVRHPGG